MVSRQRWCLDQHLDRLIDVAPRKNRQYQRAAGVAIGILWVLAQKLGKGPPDLEGLCDHGMTSMTETMHLTRRSPYPDQLERGISRSCPHSVTALSTAQHHQRKTVHEST